VGKAGLHIAFAERRVQEMAEMGRRSRVEELTMLATALDYHLEQAKGLIEVVSAQDVDIYELGVRLEQSATQQLDVLEATLDEVPEEVKPSMVQALETSGEEYGTAIEVVASTAPAPMLVAGVGTIQIRATDPPPPEADSVLLEVDEIEIHRVAGPESEWLTIVGEPITFDLLVIGEVQKFLGSQEVPDGTYTQLRFIITKATVIVDDEEHDVVVPSGKLRLVRPFQIEEGEMTLVLLDFDGGKSLHMTGGGKYMLRPKVNLLVPPTGEIDEDEEEDEEEEEVGEEMKETKVEIEGTIASFSETELVLVVAGQEVVITLDALTEIEGDLEEGARVEVEAVAEDGVFLATEIEVEEEEEQEREKERERERERVEAEEEQIEEEKAREEHGEEED